MARKTGALPSQTIHALMRAGLIKNANSKNVQPSSIDLSLTNEIWRMPGVVMPNKRQAIRELIDAYGHRHPRGQPLERGVAYMIRAQETLDLSADVYGGANPKSSTGRLDIHSRVLCDYRPRFDTIPRSYVGDLWISVVSNSFPVLVHEGTTLSQLRLFNADGRLEHLEMNLVMREHKLLWSNEGHAYDPSDIKITDSDGSCILTLDLECSPIGWAATSPNVTNDVLDLGSPVGHYQANDFFRPIEALSSQRLALEKNTFYILSSREHVRVPPELACEMRTMDDRSGEFRAHYAGFIDPGWGYGKKGETKGRPLTLEVRSHENLIVWHGHPIAKIGFERMAEVPDVPYDAGRSNYLRQTDGPRLAKIFK